MADPSQLTWQRFEHLVQQELKKSGVGLEDFGVQHHEVLVADDGSYVIDNTARFEALGAEFLVLVECKHHRRRVEREDVQVLNQKLQSTGAHKGMLFSTSGFQSGALEFAKRHRIALAKVIDGQATFETKGRFQQPRGVRPDLPAYATRIVAWSGPRSTTEKLISRDRPEFILEELEGTSDV